MRESDLDEEALYDSYLDACLAGPAPTPSEFLDGRGDVSAGIQERLAAAYALAAPSAERGEDEPSLPFERLGGYRIKRLLGMGGMGSVYVAEQESLGRTVALKVIRAELRASSTMSRRFEREARAVARLRHRNIVNVYEFGRDHGFDFIAMELVPGQPLDAVLRDAPPDSAQILGWGAELARALAHAHEQGIVHRDVKPQNVMITPAGRPVLLDFGLARLTGSDVTRLTHDFAGTPQYAAPEQLVEDGDGVSGRTDIYALGVTLYEALTGCLPYEGGRIDELLLRILREEPVPLRRVNPSLSVDVETVVLKMMEKQPERRYATAWAAAEDIQRAIAVEPIQARRPGPWVAMRKWTRRHPALASLLGAAALALLVSIVLLVRGVLADHEAARGRVEEARELVGALRASRLAIRPDEETLQAQSLALGTRWHEPAEMRAFEARKDKVDAHRRDREVRSFRVLELLSQAQRLYPDVGGVTGVRAALFLERMEAARTAGNAQLEAHYRRELLRVDPGGGTRAALESKGSIRLTTTPPGASVHLLRFRTLRNLRPEGDRRLVPVPVLPPGTALPKGVRPGAHVLRVDRGAGAVGPGDLIVSILGAPVRGSVFAASDGEVIRRGDRLLRVDEVPVTSLWQVDAPRLIEVRSLTYEHAGRTYEVLAADRDVAFIDSMGLAQQGAVEARVFRGGEFDRLVLPRELQVRPTAAPRYLLPGSVVGTTPLSEPLVLPTGSYVLVLRLAGHEQVVLPVSLAAGEAARHHVALPPLGSTPPGFVFVPGNAGVGTGTVRPEGDSAFWMQEREVMVEDYVAFLNDRARWHASGAVKQHIDVAPPFLPEFALVQLRTRAVMVNSIGQFAASNDARGALPLVNVTWDAARAFARWQSLRTGRVHALPSLREWMRAAGGDGRRYPFGNDFRPTWARTLVSRPGPPGTWSFEPAFRYPIDESPLGVFDMTGNASEWLDHVWGQANTGQEQFTGGSAGLGRAELFRLGGGGGSYRDVGLGATGFRLVVRSKAVPR